MFAVVTIDLTRPSNPSALDPGARRRLAAVGLGLETTPVLGAEPRFAPASDA